MGYVPPAKICLPCANRCGSFESRLQLLEPFKPWEGTNLNNLRLLAKIEGKCTTDGISPAGKKLVAFSKYLDNISENMLTGGVNAFREEIGKGKNFLSGTNDFS